MVSFLNNSTEVNLVLFSLIDDCKSLFHSFHCKKIIHMFREANQSTDFVVFSSSPLGVPSCRVLISHLFYVFLETSFYNGVTSSLPEDPIHWQVHHKKICKFVNFKLIYGLLTYRNRNKRSPYRKCIVQDRAWQFQEQNLTQNPNGHIPPQKCQHYFASTMIVHFPWVDPLFN